MRSIRTWRVLLALSAMATAAALMVGVGPTNAAPAANSGTGGTAVAVRMPMKLDCTNMTAAVHTYAVAHGYCAEAAAASARTAIPDNRVHGNCGDSWIYITALGGGWARITYGFQSSQGVVVYRWLGVAVRNFNGHRSDFLDASVMFSTGYANNRNLRPGIGRVDVGLAGFVTLWWGGQCTILNPADWTIVF
jgi:hypothetical protein